MEFNCNSTAPSKQRVLVNSALHLRTQNTNKGEQATGKKNICHSNDLNHFLCQCLSMYCCKIICSFDIYFALQQPSSVIKCLLKQLNYETEIFTCSFCKYNSSNVFAQPIIRGQKAIGGNGSDFFGGMYITKDGGLVVGGWSESNISGEKTENNRGFENTFDYWIVKMDSSYKIQWDKTIGGSGEEGGYTFDILFFLQQTSDRGYILGGYSSSNVSGEKTERWL